MAQLNSTKPKYPAKSYRNYLYFINDAAAEYYTNFSPGGAPSWNGKPPSPLGEGACSVMWGNAMIIFGGLKSNTTTQMYDFSAKTWKILAPMALAHFFFGCVLMPTRDKVLVVSTIPGGDERRSDIYDIAKNVWNLTGSTVNARGGTSLVTLGQIVFAIGGNSAPSPTNLSATVEEYDTAMGTWSLVNATLITARMNFGVLSLPAALFSHLPQGCKGVQ
jgi:N-acetylneuraminic acid mutarotase